jgi:threonine/homoserine/homoserine lactone efflux protein
MLAALGVLVVLTILPGPDMAVMTKVAIADGRGAASRTALGIVTGLAVWGVLTAAGLAAVLAASAKAYAVVKVAGAIYLVYLGVQTIVRRRRPDDDPVRVARGSFRTGLTSNLLNPKIAVFYTSLLPQLVPDGAPETPTLLLLVAAHIGMGLVWLNLYAVVLQSVRTVLQRPVVRRTLDVVTGTILVAFGVRVAVAE